MVTVITYGTYDLLHHGHVRLLKRAKALGDYLIVGVTSDDFDKTRGKINVQQSLIERVEAVKATGIADQIIVEEYEGQKIDDILRYGVDVFTVGSDWIGKFDYLNQYCDVIYLERTEGVSSSEIRAEQSEMHIGLVGDLTILEKLFQESELVNGAKVTSIWTTNPQLLKEEKSKLYFTNSYEHLLDCVDAVYIASHPSEHYKQIKLALQKGKHVLCAPPVALTLEECKELHAFAQSNKLVLMDAIKTAYSTAYNRLLLMLKSGKIGKVLSVDSTCTSMRDKYDCQDFANKKAWNSICEWGPTAMLPIFQILGINWNKIDITALTLPQDDKFDLFTKINFTYPSAVASLKVGKGVKSEGELIISGTKGYMYVPAPWWKTDYFEVRYENQTENKRYFYQLDGEGIRYELVAFMRAISHNQKNEYVSQEVSECICSVIELHNKEKQVLKN